MSDTGCGRLISVLAFYVFSCSCFHGSQPRKPSREIRNESQLLWREEIESGPTPSFLKSSCRQSSRGSSRINNKSSRVSTPSSAKATRQFSLSVKPDAEPQPLENLVSHAERQKCERITTVTVSELPKIHPPINDRHPPVVSALPESKRATAWMTLPPPPARVMRALNRAIHIRKTSQGDRTDSLYLAKQLTDLENSSLGLNNSVEKPVVTLVENVEHSIWRRRDEGEIVDSEAAHVSVFQNMLHRQLHDIHSPKPSTDHGAEYGCRYLDPNPDATSYILPYDEDFLSQSPSTTTLVEIIQRPPPVFKGSFLPPKDPDVFEDIYG